jgi:hypothetical protein
MSQALSRDCKTLSLPLLKATYCADLRANGLESAR